MRKLLALATTIALSAACAVHDSTVPSVSGPSETALSLKLFANPDHIPQDGLNASKLSVIAYDAGGHAIAIQVHLDVSPTGFGKLSTDFNGNVVTTTDASKPAVVSYTPPAATTGTSTTVTIFASTVGANSAVPSTNQISLIAQPAVGIVSTSPTASMTITPTSTSSSYATNVSLSFDGTASCGGGLVNGVCGNTSAITKYVWNFGDGSASLSGGTVGHAYTAAGTYTATVTVTNDKGFQASASQTIIIASVTSPTAAFTFSPTPVTRGAAVNFNAATSAAAAGHSISQYDWNFGDGTSASGSSATQTHVFTTAGTYTVTLTVTDDVGQKKTTSSTVTVT